MPWCPHHTLKKKFEGRYVYSIHLPLELKSLLQGQVFHCCVQGSTFTPHPSWENHVTSLTRLPGRTQVQIKWNEFRPCQLQNLFIRDWGKYWNQQDDWVLRLKPVWTLSPENGRSFQLIPWLIWKNCNLRSDIQKRTHQRDVVDGHNPTNLCPHRPFEKTRWALE